VIHHRIKVYIIYLLDNGIFIIILIMYFEMLISVYMIAQWV